MARSNIHAMATPDGGHNICTDQFKGEDGKDMVLVVVRPVGTLDWGELTGCFSHRWIPDLIHALEMAERIVSSGDF